MSMNDDRDEHALVDFFVNGMPCGGSLLHNDGVSSVHEDDDRSSSNKDNCLADSADHDISASATHESPSDMHNFVLSTNPTMITTHKVMIASEGDPQQCGDDDTATTVSAMNGSLWSVDSCDACDPRLDDSRRRSSRRLKPAEIPHYVHVVRTKRKVPPIFPPDLFDVPSTASTLTDTCGVAAPPHHAPPSMLDRFFLFLF